MADYVICNGELYHYGVKGMKWGVRKSKQKYVELNKKKADYDNAKREYNQSFNKAYGRAIGAYSPFKKHRDNNKRRWEDVSDKAKRTADARNAYKEAKKEFNNNAATSQKIRRGAATATKIMANIGTLKLTDEIFYGGAGSRAVKSGAAYVKNKILDKAFNTAVIDASGKIIGRYNN